MTEAPQLVKSTDEPDRPQLSLLTELMPEPDPIEDAKHRLESISLLLWFIHQWQDTEEGEEEEVETRDLAAMIKREVHLTKLQLVLIGQITKTMPEPEVLRLVLHALDYAPPK